MKPRPNQLSIAVLALLSAGIGLNAAIADKKLVVAGSSVPKGQGTYMAGSYFADFDQDGGNDQFAVYGYAGWLRQVLTEPTNVFDADDSTTAWTFENVSIAGNNTGSLITRFDPDVTRQYDPPKTAGDEPEYVLIALSLGNEGLPTTTDPGGVSATFLSGLQALVQACRDRGYYPVVTLAYPHAQYTLEKYAWLKEVNLVLNTWDVTAVNLLGTIDDGNGRWADGYFFDSGHPNFLGHRELFHAIPPTLFAAIEAGRTTVPDYPAGQGFARLTRDATEPAPLEFTPAHTVHSFTTTFKVRSGDTGTVAAIRSTTRPFFLVDFGPSNDDDGRATTGADTFGRHWNNWRPQAGGVGIPAGTSLSGLVDVDGTLIAPSIDLEVTTDFTAANGIVNGGLNAPDGPHAALLGPLAVETATEDYFYDGGTGAFRISGLDPTNEYSFRFFGTRSGTDTRETRYRVSGSKADIPASPSTFSPFADIVTTGANIGSDAAYDGNDAAIGLVGGIAPTAGGEVEVDISPDVGTFAYLGLMEVLEHGATNQYGTIELRDTEIAYVAPDGREITWPADADGNRWIEIALSHRYAQQQTLLYVDGILAGVLRETLVPDQFILGGPGQAPARPDAPLVADFQDWSVNRAAWTPDEAFAQYSGALQHASLEILAPLDDGVFAVSTAVANTAQSLSEAVLNTSNISTGVSASPPTGLAAVSYERDTVELTWTDTSATESGFVLQRRRAGVNEPWVEAATLAADTTFFEDSGRIAGETYLYRIASIESGLGGTWSDSVEIAAGENGRSYRSWASDAFALEPKTFLVDFNTNASPDYGGEAWNQIVSLADPAPYALADTTGDSSAGYVLTVVEGFDTFRSGNGAPLAGYDDDPQDSLFVVEDPLQSGGAALRLSGLNPGFTYNISLLARRGTVVSGFDYTGRYAFDGGGEPVAFEWDNSSPEADALVESFCLRPDAGGNIILRITAPDSPSGSVFSGINLMIIREAPPPGAFMVDFNPAGASAAYPAGNAWNTIGSHTDTATVHPLASESGSTTDGVTLRITTAFSQTRTGDAAPPGYGTAATAESSLFVANTATGSSLQIGGLDPGRAYDLVILARRNSAVSGFDYTGVYTVNGAASESRTVDAANNNSFTTFSGVLPDPSGTISLTVDAGPGSGTDFPVLNLLILQPAAFLPGNAPAAAPNDDPEGDGLDNFTEYAAGLDPLTDDAFRLQLHPMGLVGGSVALSYECYRPAQGAVYTILAASDFVSPASWIPDPQASQAVTSLDGSTATVTVATSPPSPANPRFWRLDISPQSP